MNIINQRRLISKEDNSPKSSWEGIIFNELAQDLLDSEVLKLRKENDTPFNFEYVLSGVLFSSKEWSILLDKISNLPDSHEKSEIIKLFKQ